MITLQHHITHERGGNVSAFAKAMAVSRPTVYRWLRDGAIWHNGRVFDPVTPAPVGTENVLDVITDMDNAQKMVRVFAEKLPAKDVLKSHHKELNDDET